MKVSKSDLKATIEVIGKIVKLDFKDSKKDNEELNLQIQLRYSSSNIFAYVKSEPLANKIIDNFSINDVITIKGNFVVNWYPGARSSLPVIDDVYCIEKLGILE